MEDLQFEFVPGERFDISFATERRYGYRAQSSRDLKRWWSTYRDGAANRTLDGYLASQEVITMPGEWPSETTLYMRAVGKTPVR